MPVRLPEVLWPPELIEEGPPEDPAILLSGPTAIGRASYRILAVRLDPDTLAVDYRPDLPDDVYNDCDVEGILEELTFLEDITQSVLVPIAGGSYVLWMLPNPEAPLA